MREQTKTASGGLLSFHQSGNLIRRHCKIGELSCRAPNFVQKPALRSFLDLRSFSAEDNVVERGNTI